MHAPSRSPDSIVLAAHALSIDRVTAEIVAAFSEAGIRSILLKGPSFSALLYPEGGRTYGDSDLLVRLDDVPKARRILIDREFSDLESGYGSHERNPIASTFNRHGCDRLSGTIDLHWTLRGLKVTPDQAWHILSEETQEMRIAGFPVTILNVAGRALHVALHAATHGLMGPEPYDCGGQTGEDLRRAIRTIGREDWIRAATLAKQLGAEEGFAFGLRLEPEGVALAEELELTANLPESWRFPAQSPGIRGGDAFSRLLSARTAREKATVLRTALLPSRGRVRRVANSRFGRLSLAGAYLEYWTDVVIGVIPAIRDGLARQRSRNPARRRR